MSALTDKISEYIRLSSELANLKKSDLGKSPELERKYTAEFNSLKGKLNGYFSKTRPTVEILCNLYRTTIRIVDKKICIKGECPQSKYSPTEACELAIRLCNESISYLSQVIKKINVDTNLYEFAKRYNTAIEIYLSVDRLAHEAISLEMSKHIKKIDLIEEKLCRICSDEDEFKHLLCLVKDNSRQISDRVFIQDRKEMESELVTQISLPIGYDSCSLDGNSEDNSRIFLSTLDWDLHKDGVFVVKVKDDEIDDDKLSVLMVNTIAQFLFSYPTFTKKVLLCDSRSSVAVTSFAGILKSENNKMFFDNDNDSYIKNSDADIRDSLAELNQIINQRLLNMAPSTYDDVLSFNKNNPDNPVPLIFVLLNGYPSRYDGGAEDLVGILKNGKKVGVYVMIVESTVDDEEKYYYRYRVPKTEDVTDNIAFFVKEKNGAYLSKNGKNFGIDTCGENYNLAKLLSVFNEKTSSDAKKIKYFESILSDEIFEKSERRVNFSRDLSIPVGKVGSNIVNIHLDASTSLAHLAVTGSSGSGKTAFINTLVLSMCSLYSPDEVELHMILMAKDDFLVFRHHNLPHLKNIVTGDQVSRANDVLDYIDTEISRRRNLIGTDGDIYTYNKRAKEPLPRCVVIIDEFYELVKDDRDSVTKLVELAFTSRSFGVSLILSTIRFPADTNKILPEVGNRVEFLSRENAGYLIPVAAKRQGELGDGLCFFYCNGKTDLATIAYSESGDPLEKRIKRVCDKYPHHRMKISNDISVTRISGEDDVTYNVTNKNDKSRSLDIARENYNKDWVLRVRLGEMDMLKTPLEFSFDNNNNVLFLFGRYLDTKLMETALMKDALVLSRDAEGPAVFYIDCNDDVYYRYKTTVVKDILSFWDPSRVVYSPERSFDDLYADINELIEKRQKDRTRSVPLYPVLVVISQGDVLFQENTQSSGPFKEKDKRGDKLVDLITRGSKTLINFVIQFEQPIKPRSLEKYMTDAVIFPGNSHNEYSDPTAYLCSAFDCIPASSTPAGRQLKSKIIKYGIDSRLHLLCNKGMVRLFLPYDYDEKYLKNIAGLGDLL